MLKEEARELLKGQQWKENTKYYALTLSKVDMPTYNKVCEAFNCLNMGYSADTLNLSKKETERFRNVHVGAYQFQRGQIFF